MENDEMIIWLKRCSDQENQDRFMFRLAQFRSG